MGYNIEVSFNISKHSSVTELQEFVKEQAQKYNCSSCYEDYEYETNVQFKRNHCIMTTNFDELNIIYFIAFLKNIKLVPGLYIECIYDDANNSILYASSYYLTQKMEKHFAKTYKTEKRKRSYSEDDIMILNEVEKKQNK
jgi:hypothetical protein